jgi:putative chitinase
MIKIERLSGIVPAHILEKVPGIKQINGPLRLCHFLSQCDHESGHFSVTHENLNYRESALRDKLSKYFNAEQAVEYRHKPDRIANRIYANRMGNSDEASGDGWKYRGRGYIQLTGRDNYASFGRYAGLGLLDNPQLVSTRYPLESAAWFFTMNSLWKICDEGHDFETIKKLTKRINGGLNGIDDRERLFYKYWRAINE